MSSFERILFATDFSSASRKAFEEAIAVAKANNAELIIAHAYQPPSLMPTDLYIAPAVYDELDRVCESARKRNWRHSSKRLAGKDLARVGSSSKAFPTRRSSRRRRRTSPVSWSWERMGG